LGWSRRTSLGGRQRWHRSQSDCNCKNTTDHFKFRVPTVAQSAPCPRLDGNAHRCGFRAEPVGGGRAARLLQRRDAPPAPNVHSSGECGLRETLAALFSLTEASTLSDDHFGNICRRSRRPTGSSLLRHRSPVLRRVRTRREMEPTHLDGHFLRLRPASQRRPCSGNDNKRKSKSRHQSAQRRFHIRMKFGDLMLDHFNSIATTASSPPLWLCRSSDRPI